MTELVPTRLEGISPKAYEHPADRAATAALQSIPGLDVLVTKLVELRWERTYRQLFLANSVKVGPDQLSDVWRSYERVLEAFAVRRVGELTKWVQSDEYDRILRGEYPRRDEPADPRMQAGEAVEHYRQRFLAAFREAGESVDRSVDRLEQWLRTVGTDRSG